MDAPTTSTDEPSIAVTGLAAMGAALARNIAGTGRTVHVHNRTPERTRTLVDEHGAEGLVGADDLDALIADMEPPRLVIAMIASGPPIDDLIGQLRERLDPGDVIVDAGNSDFRDTERRAGRLTGTGIGFLGMGVSGGEEGARLGPSLMPAGDRWAFELAEPVLVDIAARATDGTPCCAYLGTGGAGHYVKMVHNGIEYADMGAIAEAVELLRRGGRDTDEMAAIVEGWNGGELGSFLLEITARILRVVDDVDDDVVDDVVDGGTADRHLLLDRVADRASQKGTGRLTAQEALELGEPATTIAEATFHRSLSALVDRRRSAALGDTTIDARPSGIDPDDTAAALLACRLVALAQGFDLLAAGSEAHGWELDLPRVAEIWRAGCIIRSVLLDPIAEALRTDGPHLVTSPAVGRRLDEATPGWRRTTLAAIGAGVPVPVMSSALAWRDALATDRLPTALIQAQRDVFGAHTYERTDRDGTFHSSWTPTRPGTHP